ncbi:MAG TPA: hypothetical protein VEK76_02090, partial [Candidatus Binatia bacterium]|nr:hypothetical protein [Candidatus Binatia bacterium]
LGDGVFNLLAVRHVPSFVAAATGEAAIDLPDKLLTVALALGIVRALQDRVLVKPTTRPSHRASVAPRAPAPC